MQWNTSEHAGFTTGMPWLPAHENYREINAEAEEKDADSVLSYYKQIIRLRKTNPVLLSGVYEELLADNEQIYAFSRTEGTRRIVTAVNFSLEEAQLPAGFLKGVRLIGSYTDAPKNTLRPLEAVVYEEEVK